MSHRNIHLFPSLLGALLCVVAATPSFAAPVSASGAWSVKIDWRGVNDEKLRLVLCRTLGEKLLEGTESAAPFGKFSCAPDRPPAATRYDWLLRLNSRKNRLSVVPIYIPATGAPLPFEAITLERGNLDPRGFKKTATATALAKLIVDSLPAAGIVPPAAMAAAKTQLPLAVLEDSAPSDLIAYTLTFDDGKRLWLARPCGVLSSSPGSAAPRTFRNVSGMACQSGQTVWFHGKAGPGHAQDERMDALVATLPSSLLFTRGSSSHPGFLADDALGYAGIRIGSQGLSSDPLLKKTFYVGAFAEWRAPPLAGLRLIFEGVPNVESSGDAELTRFGWNRLQVAYAFGLSGIPGIDRIELAPRIGIMSLVAEALLDEEGGDAERFAIARQPAFGATLTLEKSIRRVTFRSWLGGDLAIPVLDTLSASRISSLDGGLDLFYSPPWTGREKRFSLLFFGMGELMTIKKERDDVELQYLMGFLGMGASAAL